MAKKARMDDADRISSLPDSVISHILSFLSTKDAVRTSSLSTRWRYCFALVSNLDFEFDESLLRRRKRKRSIINFESFVERVLFVHHTTSIEKFRLKCGWRVDTSRICSWISAALCRGVQHFDLNILRFTTLPGDLFTCRTLVTMKLDDFHLKVPNDVYLPNLKTLHLKSMIYWNDDSVTRLFSGCISLEDLVLEKCNFGFRNFNISHNLLKRLTLVFSCCPFSGSWLWIDAPRLVYFKYTDYQVAGYSFKTLQSLVSADINFVPLRDGSYSHHQADATPFFRGICNVQSLNLSSNALKLFLSCEPVPDFPNMVQLNICNGDIPWSVSCQEKGLATLLRSSPALEKLTFCQKVFSYLPDEVPSCLLFKLKEIEILEFEAGEDCIEKAKFVLTNAGALEQFTIRASHLSEKEQLKIAKQLLASPRQSKQLCVFII